MLHLSFCNDNVVYDFPEVLINSFSSTLRFDNLNRDSRRFEYIIFFFYREASIKLIFKIWWIGKERRGLISQSLWSSCVTTPLWSLFRSGQRSIKYFLNDLSFILSFQSDSGDPGDDNIWRDHHYDRHWWIFPWPHIPHCLRNSGNWLGCLRSGSHLQHPLLCSPSFTGDSRYRLVLQLNIL